MKPTIYGIGIRDLPSSCNGKPVQSYVVWRNTLRRCYDENYYIKYPQYFGVKCHPDWHLYSCFKSWFDKQTENIDYYRYKYQVDKDLLGNGLMYSAENCCMLPKRLNVLLAGKHNHIIISEAKLMLDRGLIDKLILSKIEERLLCQ
tara:strand:+ start:14159 stop:14596 length:438 start_codon:yes stop_codon:yes gene_type:complete